MDFWIVFRLQPIFTNHFALQENLEVSIDGCASDFRARSEEKNPTV